jgi:maltooligosyltrehalose trehalohydrolase
VQLVLESGIAGSTTATPAVLDLTPTGAGGHERHVPGIGAGARYRFLVDGRGPWPDPASRFQPDGVHGASQVVDPGAFTWSDAAWGGAALASLVIYELHVGTFTRPGTFAAAAARLPELVDLGITAIELMPVADFPGNRNWGYDGAALFAPARCYGTPDDLRALGDTAHKLGLAVLLDVVYNHVGPDGAYIAGFGPLLSRTSRTPWGAAINLDGPHSGAVRELLIQNAEHWLTEYHVDGFRFDATADLIDTSTPHFMTELTERARAAASWPVVLIAEDVRNERTVVTPARDGGWGCDAIWSFDYHHQAHRLLTGERAGYYVDYADDAASFARVLADGWLFRGEPTRYWRGPRGTDPSGVDPARCVVYLQNHDEAGNRPAGERLHHLIDPAVGRATTALLLLGPHTPLLFMGQEWNTARRFRFFTDHPERLGSRVHAGRRAWLAEHREPDDPLEGHLDAQELEAFDSSVLDWDERDHEPHLAALALHRELLAIRRSYMPAFGTAAHTAAVIERADAAVVVLSRPAHDGSPLVVVACLRGAGEFDIEGAATLELVLDTEQPRFAGLVDSPNAWNAGRARFTRPGSFVLGIPRAR